MLAGHQGNVWHVWHAIGTQAVGTLRVLTARSCGFFRPGNTILVPGMYFFGACAARDKSHDTPGHTVGLATQHGCTACTDAAMAPTCRDRGPAHPPAGSHTACPLPSARPSPCWPSSTKSPPPCLQMVMRCERLWPLAACGLTCRNCVPPVCQVAVCSALRSPCRVQLTRGQADQGAEQLSHLTACRRCPQGWDPATVVKGSASYKCSKQCSQNQWC